MTVRVEPTADSRFGTNSYLVEDEATHDAVVIDSNLEPELVIDIAKQRGAKVKAILLTHTDIDHIAGLHELRMAFGPIPIAVHEAEKDVIEKGRPLRREFGPIATRLDNVTSLVEGEPYRAGSLEFGAASDSNVGFAGNASGVLTLDHADAFSGTLAGLNAGDSLHLGNIAFSPATSSRATPCSRGRSAAPTSPTRTAPRCSRESGRSCSHSRTMRSSTAGTGRPRRSGASAE